MAETTTRIYELQVKLAQESLAQLKKVETSTAAIEDRFGTLTSLVKGFGASLAAGLSVGALVSFVEKSIDAAAALDDLAEKTGASVENLSKLQQVAHISGVDISIVETFLVKLNKALHGADDEAKGAALVIKSLGLNLEELKKMDSADAMVKIAKAFDKFADSGAKSAAQTVLTGKSAKDAAPYLKDLASEGEKVAKVTAEEAAKAEELQKQWRRMTGDAKLAGEAMARDLIPALSRITVAMHEAYKEGGLLMALWVGLGGAAANALGLDVTQKAAAGLEKVNAQLEVARKQLAAGTLKPEGASSSVFGFLVPDVALGEAAIKKIQANITKLEAERARLDSIVNPKKPPEAPKEELKYDPAEEARKAAAAAAAAAEAKRLAAERAREEAARAKKETEELQKLQVQYFVDQEEAIKKAALASNEGKSMTQWMKEQQKVLDELTGVGGMKKLAELTKLVDDAYFAGAITLQQYENALDKINGVTRDTKKEQSELAKQLESLADKVDGYAKSISDNLIDFATGAKDAKFSFTDFINSVLRDMAKMATQMLLVEPLMASFKQALKSMGTSSSGSGGLMELLGTGIKSWLSGGAAANALGGIYSSPSLGEYSGGIYTKPRAFAFASGAGVFAEAGPEAIMPLSRGADGKLGVDATGAGVTVNVYNESRAQVETKSRTDVNGNRIIELLVKDAVSNGIRSGAFDSVMGATYGLNRMGAR